MKKDGKHKKRSLTIVLDELADAAEGEKVTVKFLFDALNRKGFGPLLLVPAVLVISPIGALPGACGVLGLFIFLVCLQIFLGQKRPWLPRALREISCPEKKLQRAIKVIRPYARKLDRCFENRFSILAHHELAVRATALLSMVLAVGIMFLSLIPFAPALLAVPILFFALGLSVHDGILILLGYGVLLALAIFMPGLFLEGKA